jgi:hypothetical protein
VKPLVSVLITAHNAASYLSLALQSILHQTLHEIELILVDDGSSDATAEIGADFARRDRRVRFLQPGRLGRARALELGMRATRADLIALMDADNIAHPRRLERQCAFLQRNDEFVAVGAQLAFIDSSGAPLPGSPQLPSEPAEIWRWLREAIDNPIANPTAMLRRSLVTAIGYHREGFFFAEDLDFWLRAIEVGPLANQSHRLLHCRRPPGNTSGGRDAAAVQRTTHAFVMAELRRATGSEAAGATLTTVDDATLRALPIPAERQRVLVMHHLERSLDRQPLAVTLESWCRLVHEVAPNQAELLPRCAAFGYPLAAKLHRAGHLSDALTVAARCAWLQPTLIGRLVTGVAQRARRRLQPFGAPT